VILGDRRSASSLGGALRSALLVLAVLGLAGERAAAQGALTFTSAEANWHDATTNTGGPTTIVNGAPTTNATPTTSSISWGTPTPITDPQSGYDVTISIPDPSTFPVSSFTHRNFPIGDPSLTSVQLDFVLDFLVNGEQTGPLTFTFTFNHEETPNNLDPCPYPTDPGDGCTDRVTFIDAPDPTTFTVGGKTYTLTMTFLDENGDPVTEFITDEGGAGNTADLESEFTLVPPVLEVEKSGPATMTVGQSDLFTLDVRNTGPNDAWNTTLRDVLPDGATAGMCDTTPVIVSAQVFAADGVTPVPGKGPLVAGSDYTLSWAGAPTCELTLAMLTPAAAIDTDERLIVTYQAQLDADSQDGETLTNVAGAVEFYDDESSNPDRVLHTRTLTDGTVGTLDHQDAHTVTVRRHDYLFEKTVANVTTGDDPAVQATPGDRLRYRLRIENNDTVALDLLQLLDDVGRLNAAAVFAPGTLAVVTLPAGADASNTSATGGTNGTGVLDVRNLTIAPDAAAVIEFEIVLAASIANGTLVTNQSQLRVGGEPFADSDDPNVNGPADPFVDGDEDPTRVLIASAPDFRVQKISTDLTGDPNILLPGETLRYTITVKNVGNADAVDATLRDAVPANTTYVAGSTTLNGVAVPDGPGGSSPLVAGILISAPEETTPGAMRADASATTSNVATIVFDVVVNAGVANGTLLSNQGFVSAAAAAIVDQPSDDPATAAPDDPTVDIVGDTPDLFAPKQVAIGTDNGTAGVVDPLDVLHYTITVTNSGAIAATGAVLTDAQPANTTYVVGSMTLNGLSVPEGGAWPLSAGIPIASSDLTPPLPLPGGGILSPGGASAVIEFDLQVNAGTPAGTLISNQARIDTVELPDVLTDGDGNPATGPEPTVVVVGDGQQLLITKQVAVVGGGAALPGSVLEYTVTALNVSIAPASGVVLTDDVPALLALVPGSETLNGAAAGVTVAGTLITADYSGTYGALAPSASAVLRFRATIAAGTATGTTITNTGTVTWNTPPEQASASVSIDVGGTPGSGTFSGTVWHDADLDDAIDPGERLLQGWIVELFANGTPLQSALTAADGTYQFAGVAPNVPAGAAYVLRFRAPDAGPQSAKLGLANSVFTNDLQEIRDILLPGGSNLLGLDLPIDPNGVVYASIQRVPVPGATLTLLDAGTQLALPTSCFDDPVQQGQVTRGDGYYKFDLNFSSAACPSGGSYLLAITPPDPSFPTGYSLVIPPTSDLGTAAYDVPACPGDADPATAAVCEAVLSPFLPPSSVPPRTAGTTYHVHLLLADTDIPGSSQLFNNHIPLDPLLESVVGITKTTPSVNVSRGALVPYEITLTTETGVIIDDLSIVDRLPGGFSYVDGSARVDDGTTVEQVDPTQTGRELTWLDVGTGTAGVLRVRLLLAVGAGVSEGEFINRAQAFSSITQALLSPEAQVTVRVVPDPTFDCTDVLGKVFDDHNDNGMQDAGERGLAGVRVATARGLVATSDAHGRFHITCAVVPREDRGSNFILKLDDRTLPSGYRMTTRQVQVQRATRGKTLVYHFGAAIHRVIGLDVADAVFEPGSAVMREQWKPRIGLLVAELAKQPAILRLSYLADVEDEAVVAQRLELIERLVREAWSETERYELTIERNVYWRRGAPPERDGVRAKGRARQVIESLLPSVDAGPPAAGPSPGHSVERQLWGDEPFRRWSQDPSVLERRAGDRLEQQAVVTQQPKTVKLKNVVPPIRFESGVAKIPPGYVDRLRQKLDELRELDNVRLHLVGHADAQPLSPALSRVYGDNEGLSEERAGEVAEFLQQALGLPPEAISFAWAGDSEPVASNASAEGRAQNRRVEVEFWYDDREAKLALEEVVVPEEIKRFKICRTETVCKLRYLEGHERRARVRNLIAPLHFGEEAAPVPDEFVRQVGQALHDLRDKQNVTVKLIGFTDDVPLSGRNQRIYGDHLALSKARAHRVALALKDALDLPTAAVASDGLGASRPVAPNDTERGRALNRRIEVEFWHDDPLQQLPDDPQPCPGEAGAEVVTKVFEPSFGPLPSLPIVDGDPQVPAGYTDTLRSALAEAADRTNVRLRFTGYTRNETLDRRTARVYGDDIGLSAARARRTREAIAKELGLTDAQAEHEGRGYVHASDVVNAGFVQGDSSYVVVQVVYDELAAQGDLDGVDVTRITRELLPKPPLALNLMRITVDGEPIDDPGRSVADIQRCTDVALDHADIQFRFDGLETLPRLSVTSQPIAAPVSGDAARAGAVRFRMYSNYWPFIARSEVRIFERGRSSQSEPLAVVPIGPDGDAEWQPAAESFAGPVEELTYLLRAYDAEGRFDETAPQSLWRIYAEPAPSPAPAQPGLDPLLAAYGETGPLARNIPLGSTGSVQVQGSGIPPAHTVWLGGAPVPVDADGRFAAEVVLPAGLHTVEVAVLDESGNGELFLRDIGFSRSDWFYMAMADLTFSPDLGGGKPGALEGNHTVYDEGSWADGRLAFYLNGKFGEDWGLTASADTREEPVDELFTNFLDKSPESLFRRIDPDYHYPTFGDDGTVEEMAPTQGKFFAKLTKDESHALWGNFEVGYFDNELAQVDRGLYGGNLHYQTLATTSFGEERIALDGFAAEPGTVASREEFRGTGGSLYYLRHQDLLTGSERLRVELRDKDSGLVTSVRYLRPTLDYDIDYLQGRVMLTEPLAATSGDAMLVRDEGLSGDDVFLVAHYEYSPSFDELNALAAGGQGHVWLTDFLKLGLTASRNDGTGDNSTLYGGDLTLRGGTDSWLELQAGRSEGLVSTTLASQDGGFLFSGPLAPAQGESDANAYRADLSFAVKDFIETLPGRLSLYAQNLDAGYSAPGQEAQSDTQNFGGTVQVPITDALDLTGKSDWQLQDDGLEIRAEEVNLGYQLSSGWRLGAGVRNELREDDAPIEVETQEEGERTDAVAQIGFDAKDRWRAYGFGQGTLLRSGDRDANHRGGVGGAYRISERLFLDGEVSHGNLGPAVKLGTSFQQTEETRRYMSYAYENERGYDGLHQRTGNLISGMRTRLSDSSSVFMEDRYQHGEVSTGVARAVGLTLAPADGWSVTGHWELGNLFDRETHAETKRRAGGALVGYGLERLQLSSGVEYRFDDSEQQDDSWSDRTTWLFRNSLRYQLTPDVRVIGKYNHSFSDSSEGQFFDGEFTEAVLGTAYRPVNHDRLNLLAKYTYFYNMPTSDQVTLKNTPVEFVQKSHVAAIDATYDITKFFTLGAKYAYRLGQASLDRDDPDFFDNNAHLVILRGDYRFLKYWEGSVEGRMLDLPDQDERRAGAMLTLYQYLGDHFKVGVGYNFTDFSEDLTDLEYDHHGVFFNVVGSM
jgi:uncharacterized repeat protein (TIGR01451 family)